MMKYLDRAESYPIASPSSPAPDEAAKQIKYGLSLNAACAVVYPILILIGGACHVTCSFQICKWYMVQLVHLPSYLFALLVRFPHKRA
jgi:hypothetical protein